MKGKRVRSLEAMPLYLKEQLDTDEKLQEYCKTKLNYHEPEIKLQKIKMSSLIKVNGFYLYLTGRSGNKLLVSNGVQLLLENNAMNYVKKISGAFEKKLSDEQLTYDMDISKEKNIELYNILKEKHMSLIYSKRPYSVGDKLDGWQENFEGLSIYKQIYVLLQILQLSQLTTWGQIWLI